MAENTINIPLKGPVALVVIAVVLVIRFLTIGESNDAALRAAVQQQLLNDMGASVSQALDELDARDGRAVDELVELSNAENITLHSVKISKPLLSLGSSTDTVVRVDFTLPGRSRTTEYWRFTHSSVAGWRYRRPVTVASYYLNFF